ncbi:hypothetical protein M885DRAFT_548733 [Pelagophyceae sp. CCMP2097]|nr:hypothetical protein M885DRAFT_548733 [Pelagophyceae sp. CCMP2097]
MGSSMSTALDARAFETLAEARYKKEEFAELAVDGLVSTAEVRLNVGETAGLAFSATGHVASVADGGAGAAQGAAVGWRCYAVGGAAVDSDTEIDAALAQALAAETPCTLLFVTPHSPLAEAADGAPEGASSPRRSKAAKAAPAKGTPKAAKATVAAKPAAKVPTKAAPVKAAPAKGPAKAPATKSPSKASKASAGAKQASPRASAKAAADAAAVVADAPAPAVDEAAHEAQRLTDEARIQAEATAALGTGQCVIKYELYEDSFPIAGGSTTATAIDDVYCLSFVMKDCKIHLSPSSPADRANNPEAFYLVDEDPVGTFLGLEAGTTYWCYVQETEAALKEYAKKSKQMVSEMHDDTAPKGEDGEYGKQGIAESCSCVHGNPCVDEYGCKDWANRFNVARDNGWKEAF